MKTAPSLKRNGKITSSSWYWIDVFGWNKVASSMNICLSIVCARGNSLQQGLLFIAVSPCGIHSSFCRDNLSVHFMYPKWPWEPGPASKACDQLQCMLQSACLRPSCGGNKSCSASLVVYLSPVLSRPGLCYLVSQPSSYLSTSALPGLSLFLLWLEIQTLKHL